MESAATAFAHDPPAGSAALLWEPAAGSPGDWYRPDYSRSLTGVFPTLFHLLGRPVAGPHLLEHLPAASPRQASRVLLLTVDSFGFREWAHTRRLQHLYGSYGTWVTSVFPSITSCALSSMYQALAPARHGILGHHVWKDYPGAVVDMLSMTVDGAKASLADAGFDLRQWQREPGVLDHPPINGKRAYHLMPRGIVNSGLSTLSYGTTQRVGFVDPLEGFRKAAAMLRDLDHGWVSLYLPTIDTLTHALGGDSAEVGLAVRHIEDALACMVTHLPPRVLADTALLIAADHGQSRLHERIPLHGEPMEWLQAHTRALGFSGRVMHVYLGDHPAEPVRAWLAETLGPRGRVFGFDEARPLVGLGDAAVEHATPGTDPDWVRRSLGDLVVVLAEGYVFERRPPEERQEPYRTILESQHGALSWHEMFIPFLCAPLEAVE